MTYCRFSSDSFRSDVKAYRTVDQQYAIQVAETRVALADNVRDPLCELRNRMKGEKPLRVEFDQAMEGRREFLLHVEDAPRFSINGPEDGRVIVVDTLNELDGELRRLRSLGYRVPEVAFERLEDEMAAERMACAPSGDGMLDEEQEEVMASIMSALSEAVEAREAQKQDALG